MGMRNWLNEHNGLVLAVCLVLVAGLGAVAYLVFGGRASGAGTDYRYFYNLASRQLVPMPAGTPSPSPAGNGQIVLAHVFSCGDCGDAATLHVGYLVRYTKDAQDALAEQQAVAREKPTPRRDAKLKLLEGRILDGTQNRRKDGTENDWVFAANPNGRAIENEVVGRCGPQGNPKPCFPPPPEPK